jgi:hypothetical protein
MSRWAAGLLAVTAWAAPYTSSGSLAHYANLPLSFEENRGQAGDGSRFLARGKGYSVSLGPSGIVLHTSGEPAIHLRFPGATSAAVSGEQPQTSISSYFIGNRPERWLTGIPNYARVRYGGLYTGIDLVVYGNQGKLEYDFVLRPGADPAAIHMAFEGAAGLRVDDAGDLVLSTPAGEWRQHKPAVYQEGAGARHAIDGRYVVERGGRVRFEVARYDARRALIIDPTLTYASYLGSPATERFDSVTGTYPAIAVDSHGNAYVTGANGGTSTNFPGPPVILTGLNPEGGGWGVFVSKFNAAGTALVYSAVFGGGGTDTGGGIAVDNAGNAYVTGFTTSTNFPVTLNAPQNALHAGNGGSNAFLAKINATGTALVYSTYLGGTGSDWGRSVAVDAAGNAYVTGASLEAAGTNFPLVNALSSRPGPGFLAKMNAAGTAYVYATFLSGPAFLNPGIGYGVAADAGGNAFVTGTTAAGVGAGSAFVLAVNPAGSAVTYDVALGNPAALTTGFDIAVDYQDNAYITGSTNDNSLVVALGVTEAPQVVYGGGPSDAFAAKLNAAGTVEWATYLGGVGASQFPERGSGIGVDLAGNMYIGGTTQCIGFPNIPTQIPNTGGVPAPLMVSASRAASWAPVPLTPSTAALSYARFDRVKAVAFDPTNPASIIYAATGASNVPLSTGPYLGLVGGVYKSVDGGTTWSIANPNGITATAIDTVAVDPANGQTLYAVASGEIYTSTNAGESWTSLNQPVGAAGLLAISTFTSPSTVFVGSSTGLLMSTNAGASWKNVSAVAGPINALAADRHGNYFAANTSGVYKNGVQLNTGLTSLSVTGLAIAPTTGNVYAATQGGLFVLPSGGGAWSLLPLNHTAITPYAVAVDPSNPDNIYVALVGSGVAVSTNGGANWSPIVFDGLTRNQILSIVVQPTTNTVFAGTISATDSFVAEINASGTTLVYATCLGGSDNDLGQNLAVTPTGTAYLSGSSVSLNLPVTSNAYQPAVAGNYDAFAARFDLPTAIGPPYVDIDTPKSGTTVFTGSPVTVSGWALDNYNANGTDISSVLVLVDGSYIGTATYGISRTDVCNVLVGRPGCPDVGYTFTMNPAGLVPGPHTLTVCAVDSDVPAADTGCLSIAISVSNAAPGPPSVHIDQPKPGAILSGTATVSGWAIDNVTAVGTAINPATVIVSVDGKAAGTATYGVPRADVCGILPGRPGCPNVGYTYQLNAAALSPGAHTITVSATDTDVPTPDTGSASVMVTVPGGRLPGPPSVFIDSFPQGATLTGTATVSGWAVDNSSGIGTAISGVQIQVDGKLAGTASYGTSRPDVCAVLPGRPGCPYVGFTFALNTLLLTPGAHTITAVATDSDSPPDSGTCTLNVTVATSNAPSVVIDNPPAGLVFLQAGSTTISGWALDNVSSVGTAINPNSLQVTVDGNAAGNAVYGGNRQDICNIYNRPGCPNVGFSYALNTAALPPGVHTLVISAADTDPTPLIGVTAVNLSVVASTTPPSVWIDLPKQGTVLSGMVTVSGWAIDNRSVVGTAIGSVQVQVDGVTAGLATYGTSRADVCAIIVDRPGCPNVGYSYSLNTASYSPGAHTITVVATDTDATPDSGPASVSVTFASAGGS